jgi:hypothetical protein
MELQKRVKSNGKVKFRTKFGRDKVAVLSKGGDYFYINLYDNRPKYKGNKIFFGVDEIEELVRIKGSRYVHHVSEKDTHKFTYRTYPFSASFGTSVILKF